MQRRRSRAAQAICTVLMAATVLAGSAACGSDDGGGGAAADCVEALLGNASVNTDSFASITVSTNESEGVLSGLGDVTCSGRSRAADISYAIGHFGDGAPVSEEGATGDTDSGDIYVSEPGGNAADRLADPGDVWADQPGALELASRLLRYGGSTFELAAPDPDRGPVRLVGSGATDGGNAQVIWQFATEGEAARSVGALSGLVAERGQPVGEPEVDGVEVRIEVVRPGGLIEIDPDLALATG